uniref:Zinc_ribbon_16 domain-containing protein n=1 Tax=Elaeophora elaphi TaxID=1147741 RepID=A0A0R3S432_9BILA
MCGWPAFGDMVQLDAFIDENVTERRTQSRAVAAALITANSSRMEKTLNSMLEKARESNDECLSEMEAFQEALQHYRELPEQWGCREGVKDIPLEDRIAFAAIHFSDQYFIKSMKELFTDACLYRTLFGLLIIGISYEKATHDLLSQYVDYTGDIQTATILLVVGRCFMQESSWPAAYTSEEVASTDFELLTVEDNEAEICCQFCPQNITLDKSGTSATSLSSAVLVPATRPNISATPSTPSIPAREIACPHCLKPLPKCILCRRHMGSYVQTECHELGHLSSWFTWCQKCRHGGHMAHLWHWFSGHAECAASGCLCNCKMEDIDMVRSNVDLPQPCLFCDDAY